MYIQGKNGISRNVTIVIIVVIVIVILAGASALALSSTTHSTVQTTTSLQSTTLSSETTTSSISTTQTFTSSSSSSLTTTSTTSPTTTSSTQSTTSTSATSSTSAAPSTFTWETTLTPSFLDPAVLYDNYGAVLDDNTIYENLVWYNGTSTTNLIPWLAQNYTESANRLEYNFTLRQGITFADGEPFNSSAVYFSLNRVLVMDGSTPTSHGTQFAHDFQQLLNESLSTALCGCTIKYTPQYVQSVLDENFVQITGPYTVTLHVMVPSSFFLYILANYNYGFMLAPEYVMQHDLALWNQSSTGYTLPYPSLSGNLSQQMNQYYLDEAATCNSGVTPSGCATTYLDGSYQGSLAGTGPYTMTSFSQSSNDMLLQKNPTYWGGPYQFMGGQKIDPAFTSVQMNYVPDLSTREFDLENAAKAGGAMAIDVPGENLFDVADRNSWLSNNQLVSTVQGISIYGPNTVVGTNFIPFDMNVSNPMTGTYYQFQPFADQRIRLAFADAVNVTSINIFANNNLGQEALNVVPPAIGPNGVYNSSITPAYSFNPDESANLLLEAMEHPLTQFTFVNGTAAPAGVFNNTFGCQTLGSSGTCAAPVQRQFSLTYDVGDTLFEAMYNQIATTINNISSTYNMGLTVTVTPLPIGTMYTQGLADQLYSYATAWIVDYPWVTNILGAALAPGENIASTAGWNFTVMGNLYQQAIHADGQDNISGLISVSNAMNTIANSEVEYIWVNHPENVVVMTSSVHGFFYNSALGCIPMTCITFATLS